MPDNSPEFAMELMSSLQNLMGRIDNIIDSQRQQNEIHERFADAVLSGRVPAAQAQSPPDGRGHSISVEEQQVMSWYRDLSERLGHLRPPEVRITVEGRGQNRVLVIEGQPLAYASSIRVGNVELPLTVDESTVLRLAVTDLASVGIAFPASVSVRRGDRAVGAGIARP